MKEISAKYVIDHKLDAESIIVSKKKLKISINYETNLAKVKELDFQSMSLIPWIINRHPD